MTKKFVVAYASFDNVLKQEIVEASNAIQAMLSIMHRDDYICFEKDFSDEESVKYFAFDRELLISVLEI